MRATILAVVLALAAGPAFADPLFGLSGYVPGAIDDIVISGGHAFCTARAGLVVLDLTPAAPVQLAFLPLGGADVLALDGGLAYVAGAGVLSVVDVADPSAPVVLGSCAVGEWPGDIAATGGVVCLTTMYGHTLEVVDALDPQAPFCAAVVGLAEARGVAMRDDLAFIAAGSAGLRVVSVAAPAAPHEIGSLAAAAPAYGVALAGDVAAVARGYAGLMTVDVSTPAQPLVLGVATSAHGGSNDLVIADGHAFVPRPEHGLVIIDVSDPLAPTEVGFLPMIGRTHKVAVAGATAWVASGYRGVQGVDAAAPAAPSLGRLWLAAGDAAGICLRGDHAYVAGGHFSDAKSREGIAGLVTVNTGALPQPAITGFLPIAMPAIATAAAGDVVFVLDWFGGLHACDLADPAAPALLGSCDLYETGEDLALSGSFAFAACGAGGLCIVDVSDPDALCEVGHLDLDESASGVVVRGDVAYVTEYYSGLYTVDVRDPAAPVIVDFASVSGAALAVDESEGRVQVASGSAGVQIFDASDPWHPVWIGAIDTPGIARDVAAEGPALYVADGDAGVQVYDAADPAAPLLIASIPEAAGARTITYDAAGLAAGGFDRGLFFLGRLTQVAVGAAAVPAAAVSLDAPSPNPFNPRTTLSFTLAGAGPVTLRIHDLAGRAVRTLIGGEPREAGRHLATWDGCDDLGRPLPAGLYLARVSTPAGAQARKLALVR